MNDAERKEWLKLGVVIKYGKTKKHKEIEELYKIKGYELLNEYKNNRTKLFLKDEYGYICSTSMKC